MGKKKPKSLPVKNTKEGKTYPSEYGSHKTMVIDTPTHIQLQKDQVLCQDQNGTYITESYKLDNGMADPNRYSQRKPLPKS